MLTIATSAALQPSDRSGADKIYMLLRENLLAGSHCSLGPDVTVTGTVMLEDCVTIHKSTSLHGLLYIENNVKIGENSQVGLAEIGLPKAHSERKGPGNEEFTWIQAGARIGHHTYIDKGVIIGAGAWLEPFSRADCNVPPGAQAGGSPLILRGYLCSQCGSLLAPQNKELERCAADLSSGTVVRPLQVECTTAQQIEVICRVCGSRLLFASQQWCWVGRELPLAETQQAGRIVEPAGLHRFMKW